MNLEHVLYGFDFPAKVCFRRMSDTDWDRYMALETYLLDVACLNSFEYTEDERRTVLAKGIKVMKRLLSRYIESSFVSDDFLESYGRRLEAKIDEKFANGWDEGVSWLKRDLVKKYGESPETCHNAVEEAELRLRALLFSTGIN